MRSKRQSHQEKSSREDIIPKLIEGQITRAQAAQALCLSLRRVDQLKKSYKEIGAAAFVPKQTQWKPRRTYQEEDKQRFIQLIQEKFCDFGPTLIKYQLSKMLSEKIPCKETLRQSMIEANLHQAHQKKEPRVHRLRERKEHYGTLIQMDGSFHDWLGSGEKLTLLVMIDDATSQIQALHFCQQESTDTYLFMMRNYLLKHGKPQRLYVDKHAVFSVNRDDTSSKNFMTSFHQAMTDLDIELILASTPQAKGRVERVNRTLQDRLVKELKLRNIKTMEEANTYLPTYMKEHNQLFALPPAQEEDFHRKLTGDELHTLEQTLAKRAYRSVSKSLTVDFMGVTYQLLESSRINRLRSQGVQCRLQLDGSLAILDQEGRLLDYRVARVKKKAPPMMSKKSLQQRQHEQDRAIDNFLRRNNQRSA